MDTRLIMLIFAVISSFAATMVLGIILLPVLRRLKFGQSVREDGPQSHLKKQGTPTMGGLIFLFPMIIVPLLFAKNSYDFVIAISLIMFGYGLLGFLDDFIIIKKARSMGLRPYQKLIGQIGLAIIFGVFAYRYVGSSITIPFIDKTLDLGYFYIPFAAFVVVAGSNGANMTDGVDGLCSSVTLVIALALTLIAGVLGVRYEMIGAEYLAVNTFNVMLVTGAMAGGLLAFLQFNTHPAKVFMGDTGSLALGAGISVIFLLLKSPLLLIFMGAVYVIELISVIVQVLVYKKTKKRVFKMAPIHHHYEIGGMPETRVVSNFTILTVVLCLVAILSIF